MQLSLPFILGCDITGVVEAVGNDVKSFKAGDSVYGYARIDRNGGYAEYAVTGEDLLDHKPKSLDFVNAASVPSVPALPGNIVRSSRTASWVKSIDSRDFRRSRYVWSAIGEGQGRVCDRFGIGKE
jgi:hypothetical protein